MQEPIDLNWKEFGSALLNATPSGVAVFDNSLQALISNPPARNCLGLYPGAFLSATIPSLTASARKVLSDQIVETGLIVEKNDSRYSVMLGPVHHGNAAIGIIAIFEDMTALTNITNRMKGFQQLSIELDTIIDSSNDGLWICDGNGVVVRVNPASEKMIGLTAAEVVGKHMTELVEKKLVDRSVTLEVLKTRQKVSLVQKTRIGRDLLLTGTPVFDKNGDLFRVVINERDITEITRLQEQLRENVELTEQYKRDMLEKQIEETESRHIVARSDNFRKIVQKAVKLAQVDTTVLILGESGTGKGVIADLIHRYSARAGHPMIRINCGAIPDTLVESELFGYEKGAFTGAGHKGKPGKFETADKGIIFLDEIAELPLASQVKLLKFLEDGVISRVGSTRGRQVDVRIIAATNRDLKEMIQDNLFRSDLYFRLHVVPLTIPPLRERAGCLVPLITHYLDRFAGKYEKPRMAVSREAADALTAYPFPGNVRELINICERLVVMARKPQIEYEDLPGSIREAILSCDTGDTAWHPGLTLSQMVADLEKKMLVRALKKGKTQVNAAGMLGINQSTIARKIKKYGLDRP
ncbi:sigma-54 interaction domain-containing protein [Desulfotignum balticum]|uniref:sigma-54 interaction domain-containing protein n=1 Tax=Desulfotignum balticum TaxID=115781 RepID=UPI00055232A1|nr:sigma-54-dependent Fis family transcriptional regulator [Desulfotignum balticum]